jgi:galactokinase
MDESHASLRELYEVSSAELDLFTELARRHPACFGARLTGAGFGGCAIALVEAAAAADFAAEVHAGYRARVELPSAAFVCRPVAGARLLGG